MVDINKMSTFLRKTKDRKSFEEMIQTKATSTQNSVRSAIKNFEMFCKGSVALSGSEIRIFLGLIRLNFPCKD